MQHKCWKLGNHHLFIFSFLIRGSKLPCGFWGNVQPAVKRSQWFRILILTDIFLIFTMENASKKVDIPIFLMLRLWFSPWFFGSQQIHMIVKSGKSHSSPIPNPKIFHAPTPPQLSRVWWHPAPAQLHPERRNDSSRLLSSVVDYLILMRVINIPMRDHEGNV